MVLATGRFDAARLEALAREHGGQVEDYKGKRLITQDRRRRLGDKSEHSFTVAFISPGLVGVGETNVIKHAIDRQGGQSVLANREMMNLVKDMDDSNAWAVGRFDALISQAKLPEGVVSKIPAVRLFSANGHINGGVRGNIRAEARDEQAGAESPRCRPGLPGAGEAAGRPEARAAGADRTRCSSRAPARPSRCRSKCRRR